MIIIHSKTIPNLPSPNENVTRKINFYGLNVDGYEDTATIPYQVQYIENGIDVSADFEKIFRPMQWTNNETVYVRDLQGNKVSNPEYEAALIKNQLPPTIPNPEYVDEESTPDVPQTIPNSEYISDEQLEAIGEFLVAPAFTYFVTLFHQHPEIFWTFLDMYIDENYGEGWYGSQERVISRSSIVKK